MPINPTYQNDYLSILSHRYDLGADYWTSSDYRLIKGSPFSMLECIHYLLELGLEKDNPLLVECANIILNTWKTDGSFKLYPEGAILPCQTINALNTLCHLGYGNDERVQKTFKHLLDIQYNDGGWRCNKFSYGKGPETQYSNPFPTLTALNAFRFIKQEGNEEAFNKVVEFLLEHWTIRSPIGPCHYGIGTLFMQVEYPFRTYNLFNYVYVLSFYESAVKDKRFLEAYKVLESKLQDGQIVIERNVPKLSNLLFCKKNEKSEHATKKFKEISGRIK